MTTGPIKRLFAAGTLAAALTVTLTPQAAHAASVPAPPAPDAASVSAARDVVAAPGTLDTLARFFARDGALATPDATPRIDGDVVAVYMLSPEFVAARPGAAAVPIARREFLAGTAVAADGRRASVWTADTAQGPQVVNIAEGDDEARYVATGARLAPGGVVFREPQINAWYVQSGDRVSPLNADAEHAIGAGGTTVAAYQRRVHRAYADKLPGSGYDAKGLAGGFGPTDPGAARSGSGDDPFGVAPTAFAAAGLLGVAGLGGVVVRVRRRRS
ncbi:hypothetical protein [Embleya sp. NPDC020630]|uniref:hypothetical protein n=1 Tax=Embleya sp. NPDC020630 TaxID=3363979 RepID=UPI0037B3E6C5